MDTSRSSRSAAPEFGRWPPITSVVCVGNRRGRQLGFPTANLHPADVERWPGGVYAAVTRTLDGTWWPSAANVGTRPTFGTDDEPFVEVHLIGFDGDLYGETLTVILLDRLRTEVRFESVDQLVHQLARDVEAAAAAVARRGRTGGSTLVSR